MTDAEINEMRDDIKTELETDPLDGGVSMPDATDGITRYPADSGGAAISADDVSKYDGEVPPGDENQKPGGFSNK